MAEQRRRRLDRECGPIFLSAGLTIARDEDNHSRARAIRPPRGWPKVGQILLRISWTSSAPAAKSCASQVFLERRQVDILCCAVLVL
jgi:hypothetical protein